MGIKFLDEEPAQTANTFSNEAQNVEPPTSAGGFRFLDEESPAPAFEAPVYNGGNEELDNRLASDRDQTEQLAMQLFSPEELQALRNKGKINVFEAGDFLDWADVLPGAQGFTNAANAINLADIAFKMQNGDEVRPDEQEFLREYMRKQTEMSLRGFDWGGGVAYYSQQMPAFMIEFAASLGVGKAVASGGVKVAAELAEEALTQTAIQSAAQTVASGATKVVATTAAAPQLYVPNYGERRLNEYTAVTDKGEVLFKEAEEAPAITALKAFGHAGTEVASELSGAVIGKYAVEPIKKFAGPAVVAGFDKLPVGVKDALFKAYQTVKPNAKVTEVFSRTGWHGMLAELGEERVADILKTSLDLDQDEGYSFEQFTRALYPGADQLLIEAGVIAVMGGGRATSNAIMNRLQKRGYTEEAARQVVENTTQLEQEQLFDQMSENDIKESLSNVERAAFNQAVDSEIPKDQARQYAQIMKGRALWHAKTYNVGPEQYYNNLNLQINNLQAIEQKEFDRLRGVARKAREQQEKAQADQNRRDLLGDKVKPKREKPTPKPLIKYIADNGKIRRGSPIQAELEAVGITAKQYPRLFAKDGRIGDLDNIVQSEVEESLGVTGAFTAQETGYIDRQEFIDALRDETFGNYIRSDAQRDKETQEQNDDQIIQELSKRGVDVETASNRDIRMALRDAQNEYARMSVQTDTLNQELSEEDQQALDDMLFFQSLNESTETSVENLNFKPASALEIDVDFASLNPENIEFESAEQIAAWNTAVEIREALWDAEIIPYEVLDSTHKVKDIDDIDEYTVEQFLQQSGDFRTLQEIYEENLVLAEDGDTPSDFIADDDVIEWVKRAKGLTDDINEAGYILPSGELVDFSGKRQGGPSGVRYEDHRQLDIPEKGDITGTDLMEAFISHGAIRTDGAKGAMTIAKRPTRNQMDWIGSIIDMAGEGIITLHDGNRETYIKASDGDVAINNIERFYRGQDVEADVFYQENRGSIQFTKQGERIITLFEEADNSTLFHELGHMFMQELQEAARISPDAQKDYDTIADWLGVEPGAPLSIEQQEAFARGFEAYLYEGSSPSNALRKVFDQVKQWMAEIYRSISDLNVRLNNEARDVFDELLGGKSLDLYDTEIQIDDSETAFAGFYRLYVDDLNPIEKARNMFVNMNGKVPDGLDVVLQSRLFASVKSRIKHNIQTETFYYDESGQAVVTGEGLKSILDDFDVEFKNIEGDYTQRLNDFEDYLIARRYQQDLIPRDDVKVSPRQAEDQMKKMVELADKYGEQYERLDDYAQRLYGFQKRVLYNMVRSGIMSEEAYAEILNQNQNYVPFQRILDDLDIPQSDLFVGSRKRLDGKGARSVIKAIEGSDKEIKTIYSSIMQNTARIIQTAEKNQIAQSIAAMQDYMPEYVQPASVKLRTVKLEDGTEKKIPDGMPSGNVLEYHEDGKRKYVKVAKPLYESIADLHPTHINFIGRFFQRIAAVFRAGATLVPDFWIRNFGRDILAANIQSKTGVNGIDIVAGMTAAAGKNDLYKEWQKSGGPFDSYMDFSDKGVEIAFEELLRPRGKTMRYAKTLGVDALRDASGVFEEGVRLSVFKRAKEAGMSDMAAGLESRDATLDFSRAGKQGRIANRYIPFLNAGIQGADKLVRAFKAHPKAMTMRAVATITLPSVAITGYYLYAAPEDERREYLEIPQWQKDLFWIVKVGDEWKRYPKPFTLGYGFGTTMERFMLWAYQGEKPEAENLWRDTILGLGGSFSPIQDVGTLMTPMGRVLVESLTNYNFFTGRPIYSPYMDRLLPEDRANAFSSETSKIIGEAFGVSPAKVDNAIRGVLASAAPYGLETSDKLIKAVREWNGEAVPEEPITDSDKLFVRAFSVRDPSGFQAISTQNFMKRFREINQIKASFNTKKGEERRVFQQRYAEQIRAYKPMKAFQKRINLIGDQIDRIYENTNMDSQTKVERIKVLNDQILEISRQGNRWYKGNLDAQ